MKPSLFAMIASILLTGMLAGTGWASPHPHGLCPAQATGTLFDKHDGKPSEETEEEPDCDE